MKFREIFIEFGSKIDENHFKNSDSFQNFGQTYEKVSRQFTQILKLERCKGLQILYFSKKLMLQNAYLGAKIGFDAEENEPSKIW